MLDTAIGYGDSEQVLGQIGTDGWKIITKLPAVPPDEARIGEWAAAQLDQSLQRLGRPAIEAVLLHRPEQLATAIGRELYAALLLAREAGRVARIGISVYSPEDLDRVPRDMAFDIVQAPVNVLDGRIMQSERMKELRAAGCELHARSVFLQGLLLMDRPELLPYFRRWKPLFDRLRSQIAAAGMSPLAACLRAVLNRDDVDRVLVGVENANQWSEILEAAEGPPPMLDDLHHGDVELLNPALWQRA